MNWWVEQCQTVGAEIWGSTETRSRQLSSLTSSPCTPLNVVRVSSLRSSDLRLSTTAAGCWPALLRLVGMPLFVDDTDETSELQMWFYGLETDLAETNPNCPHRPISHVLPNNRWQGCQPSPSACDLQNSQFVECWA